VVDLFLASQRMNKASSRLFIVFFVVVGFTFLSQCKKETQILTPAGLNYFPSDVGRWIEYNVDSTYHSESDNNNDDSVYHYNFQMREVLDSEYTDEGGRKNQIIKRYRRQNYSVPWTLSNVWTQCVSNSSAYRTEENIRFHKLAFPVNSTVTWNGNDANMMEDEFYSYEYIDQPVTIDSIYFEKTVSVIQIDENNFVETFYGNEIYADGVGLIYKERKELGKRNGIIVKGIEYVIKVSAFGKN
jgi:hypothetical protein